MFTRSAVVVSLLASCFLLADPQPAAALYPQVSFDEVIDTADLVFTGTVSHIDHSTSGPVAYTHVSFGDVSKVRSTAEARQGKGQTVTVTYAGGPVNGVYMNVTGTPTFELGEKYLVFLLDDGRPYISPVVAGHQGYFKVESDTATGKDYLLNPTGKALTGIDGSGDVSFSGQSVSQIRNGSLEFRNTEPDLRENVLAVSSDGTQSPSVKREEESSAVPMSLDDVKKYINSGAGQRAVSEKRLLINTNRKGGYYHATDQGVIREDLPLSTPEQNAPGKGDESDALESISQRGQSVTVCGTQQIPIVIEQLPSGSYGYDINNNVMGNFNQFMGVFSTVPSDGGVGFNNGDSELCGFMSQATLKQYFGWDWNGAVALCIYYTSNPNSCVTILESDIFYNPEYDFHDDPYVWFNSSNSLLYNLRFIAQHELGHALGFMVRVNETYDYDVPTMMHGGYRDIFETGRGLHAYDVGLFRSQYDDQTSIKSITDVGIETYYAQGGLNKSTINGTIFTRGDNMAFSNVTVENLGRAWANPRIRFYLSNKHDLSGTYYQVGGNWTFNEGLSAERYAVGNFITNTIPSNVPAGQYYVLAQVDLPGISEDDGWNNISVFTDKVTIRVPTIERSTSFLSSSVVVGNNPPSQSFTIRNSGTGTLSYSLSTTYNQATTGWLSYSPSSGTSSGESDTINVNCNTAGLAPGYYSAYINISDPNATNNSQTVLVSVDVIAPRPPNDDFSNAASFSGMSGTISGTNAYATTESNEPNAFSNSKTVWWKWNAPASGTVMFTTQDSPFDTIMAVYTGAGYPLTQIAYNDDYASPERYSRVSFSATGGITYRIQVSGFNGTSGNIYLTYNLTVNSGVSDWNLY